MARGTARQMGGRVKPGQDAGSLAPILLRSGSSVSERDRAVTANLQMSVAVAAGLAATVLALVPLAGATQEAERIASLVSPVDAAIARHDAIQHIRSGIVDCQGCDLHGADFTGANLAHANLAHADLTNATLAVASIKGADLSTAKGLTQAQLDLACGDKETKRPEGLHADSCK